MDKIEMTFDEYIQNPLGKKNAVFGQREMYKSIYTSKLDKILLRENNKIDYWLYYDNKDNYYIHMKVPSEVVENFYYDTVIKFYTTEASAKLSPNLNKYNVQFFTNSPHFVFTYAHTFLEKGLFFEDMKPKMSKEAVKNNAGVRNPDNIVYYVKALYFAYLIMKNKSLFIKSKYKVYGKQYDKKRLLSQVENCDNKLADRQEEETKQKKEKAKKKPEESKRNEEKFTKNAGNSNTVKKTGITGGVKKSKKTSYIKKK